MKTNEPTGNFDQPADEALEQLAISRAEEEETPRMPTSAAEMVAATLTSKTGCIEALLSPLAVVTGKDLSSIHDLVIQIQERLIRYLQTEQKKKGKGSARLVPSVYAQQIFSTTTDNIPADALAGIAQYSAHAVAEIQPLLYALWEQYHALTQWLPTEKKKAFNILSDCGDFFAALESGHIGSARVYSFFAVLKKISQAQKEFPHIDSEQPMVPAELIIVDPLAPDQFSYWNGFQKEYRTMKNKDLPIGDIVRSRTGECLYELYQMAKHAPHERVREAAKHVSSWLWGELECIGDVADTDLKKQLADVHFAYGDPEEIMGLLNDIEILKQYEPIQYARMMGRKAKDVIPEASRSDLFGNLFQVAMYNTLHLQTGRNMEGYNDLQSYIAGLTKMQVRQDEIGLLSDEDVARFEETLLNAVQQERENPFLGVGLLKAGEVVRAYRLKKVLENVSAENRERLLRELRVATPQEFALLMNNRRLIPKGLKWHIYNEFPQDIKVIFQERGIPIESNRDRIEFVATIEYVNDSWVAKAARALPTAALGELIKEIGTPMVLSHFLSEENYDALSRYQALTSIKGRSIWGDKVGGHILGELWKTTPSERLLSGEEFYKQVERLCNQIRWGSKEWNGYEVRDKKGEYFLDIINAHPDISAKQWLAWFDGHTKSGDTVFDRHKTKLGKMIRRIFSTAVVTAEQIATSPSEFWRLCEYLFPLDEKKTAKIIDAMSAPSGDLCKLIFERGNRVQYTSEGIHYLPFSEDDMIREGLAPHENELDDVQKTILKNCKLLSRLFGPTKCADILDTYMMLGGNAVLVDIFSSMLSEKERKEFLVRLCQNVLGVIRNEKRIMFRTNEMNFLFVLLRRCIQEIPENEEYQDLKSVVSGWNSSSQSRANPERHNDDAFIFRRAMFDEKKNEWYLEQGRWGTGEYGEPIDVISWRKIDT